MFLHCCVFSCICSQTHYAVVFADRIWNEAPCDATFVKQLRLLYGASFSVIERRNWAQRVRSNLLNDAHWILGQALLYTSLANVPVVDQELVARLSAAQAAPIAEQTEALRAAAAVAGFHAYRRGFSLELTPMSAYFWDALPRLLANDYLPTDQDIVYCTSSTLGVITYDFSADGTDFHLVDCGGQCSQRRKWLRYFAPATAVLFVASLDDFWHASQEDEQSNALREAIDTFDETINSEALRGQSVILFLNKSDLLPASLERHDFCAHFPAYAGDPKDANAVVEFIKGLFLARNRSSRRRRKIFARATCAGDPKQIASMAEAIKASVLQDLIDQSQL